MSNKPMPTGPQALGPQPLLTAAALTAAALALSPQTVPLSRLALVFAGCHQIHTKLVLAGERHNPMAVAYHSGAAEAIERLAQSLATDLPDGAAFLAACGFESQP